MRLLIGPDSAARLAAAARWLDTYPSDAELLLLAPTPEAADDFVRMNCGEGARFGLARMTLERLALRLAAPILAGRGLVPASGLSFTAIVAYAVHVLLSEGKLSYFAPVGRRPGFPTAAARTIEELRMNGVPAGDLGQLDRGGPDLALMSELVAGELAAKGLADRASVYEAAIEAAGQNPPPAPVRFPLLLLDVPVASRREADLVALVARRAPAALATVPRGDLRTISHLERALEVRVEQLDSDQEQTSLADLKAHIFEEQQPPARELDDTVTLKSWPGEEREAVEIARRIQQEAARGIPFDRMAVFLRSVGEYRPHIEESFRRAEVPAYFSRGSTRPDPSGRALLALLACAAERLSARRFAEYLSLAQVPAPADLEAFGQDRFWVAPDSDLIPEAARPVSTRPDPDEEPPLPTDPESAISIEGTLQAPWRWEQLLVDAAVIGGKDRWARRLNGLEKELQLKRKELVDENEPLVALIDRQLRDLAHLRDFALPLIERLDSLPGGATWGEWLTNLRELASMGLRRPEEVLKTLAELEPMSAVGPVDLDEVQLVLAPRLRELTAPPPRRRYGAVLVGPADAARGLAFDVVFVPGLAEKLFPRKLVEDPILLDEQRREIGEVDLATQKDRVEAERLALRLAVGAARRRVYLSYPRVDVQQARPRVPSFYGLEALRAAEGKLPGFEELGARAEATAAGRLGWPAPSRPEDAIDEAEYDLALLAPLLEADPDTVAGTAHYLVNANPHLGRALRARSRRWIRRWTPADGLVEADQTDAFLGPSWELARQAMKAHQLSARSFSPTALQHFSACPYRFFLQAIHRLQPREELAPLEVIDPLTRGGLFHHVQFKVLSRLRDAGQLPVTPSNVEWAVSVVDDVLDTEARKYEDELAPAIPKVWEDGINSIRADLREWLRRAAEVDDGWVPHRFELSFGLADRDREDEDPASVVDPVPVLDGLLKLRGSIDLVERHVSGKLRATDHKTGRVRADKGVIVGGGKHLQPVLYALACEELLNEPVESGRLYYCTLDGNYEHRDVPLDDFARGTAGIAVGIIGQALEQGFLPAAPEKDACRWCDYRLVCGPLEERRVQLKPGDRIWDLKRLREMP